MCFTGLKTAAEKQLQGEAEALGATFTAPLTADVTHLVLARAGSEKHRKAQKLPIFIVEVRWLADCISGQTRLAENSYIARPFVGFRICVTQLPQAERFEMQKLIEAGGGTFERDLDKEKCTHLVAVTPEGDKFNSVKHCQSIRIMQKTWVFACVEQNAWLPEKDYLLPYVLEKRRPVPRVPAPALAPETFPDSRQVPASSWGMLRREVFFVSGFAPDMQRYFVRVICAGGGTWLPLLTERTNKALVGPAIDPK